MRTTITINHRLLERLKRRASQTGSTVSRLIEDAVRLMLSRELPAREPKREFELVTFGAGGHFTTRNIDKTAALIEADDLERCGRHH